MFFSKVEVPQTYYLIDNPKKLSWLRHELLAASEFAFDIETNYPTVKNRKKLPATYKEVVCGISFAWGQKEIRQPWKPGIAAYIPLSQADDSPYWKNRQDYVIAGLKEILESSIPKVAQNGKFDCRTLARLLNIETKNMAFDVMLAHALIDEERLISSHALKSDIDSNGKVTKVGMANAYLQSEAQIFKDDLQEALNFYDTHLRRYSKVPLNILYPYGCADSDLTLSLKFIFAQKLEEEGMTFLFNTVVMPLSHTLMLMELHGVPLDINRAIEIRDEQSAIMHHAEKEIYEITSKQVNLSSPDQVGKLLFEELKLSGGKKNKLGKWITDGKILKTLNHPIADPLLRYRRAEQIHGLYAEAALEKVVEITNNGQIGWVHPEYYMDSRTGRLKLSKPNLTTLPRPENGGMIVKSMWVADEDHYFIFKDFSQIEMRVIAHFSQEPIWIDGFNNGHDMHAAMAKKIWNLDCEVSEVKDKYPDKRSAAKTVNFGIAYGESDFSLANRLNISVEAAYKLIYEEYFGAAPVLRTWIDNTHEFVKQFGYVVTIFGRRRHLPDGMLQIPTNQQWPPKNSRPSCYREGPYPEALGVYREDLWKLDESALATLIVQKNISQFKPCVNCPYLKSCWINREVKYIKGKVNAALRQGVNSPIQGSAVDMASLALVWIDRDFKNLRINAAPILHNHDELCVYCHKNDVEATDKLMDDCMTTRMKQYVNFSVPLLVDTEIVQRWSDKHKEKEIYELEEDNENRN